jgi:acyl-CoA synthetase (AMP-forming)/AMP-acid ligase II
VEAIRAVLESVPASVGFRFETGPGEPETLDGRAMLARIDAFARGLARTGVPARTAIPILAESSPAVWASFVGAMACDLVPFLLPPPTFKTDMPTYARNLAALLARYGSRSAVVSHDVARALEPDLRAAGVDRVIELEPLEHDPAARGGGPAPRPACRGPDIAFLQHSSGTTGIPKGVALGHATVLEHLDTYSRTIGLSPADRICSWLPLYHDMGLVTALLMPLACGASCYTLRPATWILDPARILSILTREAASLAWWPNFAFALLARRSRPADVAACDLSSARDRRPDRSIPGVRPASVVDGRVPASVSSRASRRPARAGGVARTAWRRLPDGTREAGRDHGAVLARVLQGAPGLAGGRRHRGHDRLDRELEPRGSRRVRCDASGDPRRVRAVPPRQPAALHPARRAHGRDAAQVLREGPRGLQGTGLMADEAATWRPVRL